MEDELLTPVEVAARLKIAKNTVYELIKRGELPASHAGKKVRVSTEQLALYLNRLSDGNNSLQKARNNPERDPSRPVVICGQDPLLDILAAAGAKLLNGSEIFRSHAGSYQGLIDLYHGRADFTTIHLWDSETGSYNIPFVRRLLPGVATVVVRLAQRKVGFYVPRGNPKLIDSWESLKQAGIKMINREKGSGIRVLLDEHLELLGIDSWKMNGYNEEADSHLSIAGAVASGKADVGLGNEKAAKQVDGIDFIFLQDEMLDLVVKREDLSRRPVHILFDFIRSLEFKKQLESIGGYGLTETGKIVYGKY